MPDQDYSGDDNSADNNNRSMSEDEWNKLIYGVGMLSKIYSYYL